jgi:aldose 1-epimerase
MNITLKNTFADITIAPHLGGAILSYHANINGELIPILRNSESATSVSDACSFPLVPYSNRIKHGTFVWQDRTYTLPLNHLPEKHSIHGHGWQTHWQVKEKSNTHLVIEYQYNTADWPSSYLATQTFTLVDAALHT